MGTSAWKTKIAKTYEFSCDSFRSSDLRVMSPARFRCATQLLLVENRVPKLNLKMVGGFPASLPIPTDHEHRGEEEQKAKGGIYCLKNTVFT